MGKKRCLCGLGLEYVFWSQRQLGWPLARGSLVDLKRFLSFARRMVPNFAQMGF